MTAPWPFIGLLPIPAAVEHEGFLEALKRVVVTYDSAPYPNKKTEKNVTAEAYQALVLRRQ